MARAARTKSAENTVRQVDLVEHGQRGAAGGSGVGPPNLNHGQDTRANTGPDTQRAQAHNHTQNSNTRTQPRHTSRSHAHTHTPPATLSQPPPRASAPARGTIACVISTDLSASASARCLPCCCTCRFRPTSSSWRRVRPANCDWRYRFRDTGGSRDTLVGTGKKTPGGAGTHTGHTVSAHDVGCTNFCETQTCARRILSCTEDPDLPCAE